MAFIPLFCRTHFSGSGVSSPSRLAKRARGLGYSSLGICDVGTISGFHEFDQVCREEGLRPVFGCRLMLNGLLLGDERFPLDFLIRTEQGYRNLVYLLTHALRGDAEKGKPRLLPDPGEHSAGLIVIIPPDGELVEILRRGDRTAARRLVAAGTRVFGADLVLGMGAFDDDPSVPPDTAEQIRRIAAGSGVPWMPAPAVEMADPEEAPASAWLQSPGGPAARGWAPPAEEASLPALFAEEAVLSRYPEQGNHSVEPLELVGRCDWRPGANRRALPAPDFERGFDADSWLFELVIEGAAERYGRIDDEVKLRINREFEEIRSRRLAPFLLIHRQICDFMDKREISRGPGRGPLQGSVTAYSLGLTRVDPIAFDIPFVSFVTKDEKFPLIRIEAPEPARAEILEWLGRTFGTSRMARIGRRPELRRDQVLTELIQWAGLNAAEEQQAREELGRTRNAAPLDRLSARERARQWRRWRSPSFLAEMAASLGPRPRGVPAPIPGRWVLSGEPLHHSIPTLTDEEGTPLTDIGDAALDAMGALRVEFVPARLLTFLEQARVCAVEMDPDVKFDSSLRLDKATLALLARGDVSGISPLDEITIRCMLRMRRPENLQQVIMIRSDARRLYNPENLRARLDSVADTALGCQLALVKARYPAAFHAAALSTAARHREHLPALIREIRRAGIEILPVDINFSGAECSVFGKSIRLGFCMVRPLNPAAIGEILNARMGGRFNSLAEFCGGLSPRRVTSRMIQSLVAAGAFDSFGHTRARLADLAGRLQKRSRREARQNRDEPSQHTLFDLSPLVHADAEPDLPRAEWSEAVLLEKELEALGFNVDLDPLDAWDDITSGIQTIEPERVTAKLKGREVRVSGFLRSVDSDGPLLDGSGDLLADLEGLPVYLGPGAARACMASLRPGEAVLAVGGVEVVDGCPLLRGDGIWSLDEIRSTARNTGLVRIYLHASDRVAARLVRGAVREWPGVTTLEVITEGGFFAFGRGSARRMKVTFCAPLLQRIREAVPAEQIEAFACDGRPLDLFESRARAA